MKFLAFPLWNIFSWSNIVKLWLTKIFAVFYIPEVISKEKILAAIKKMGYRWKKVEDIPEEMTCWFGLFSFGFSK